VRILGRNCGVCGVGSISNSWHPRMLVGLQPLQ
jgi:hypothetical protein